MQPPPPGRVPPLGQVSQTVAAFVFAVTAVGVCVAYARRRPSSASCMLIAAIVVATVMSAAYGAMQTVATEHATDVHSAAWAIVSIVIVASLMLLRPTAGDDHAWVVVGVWAVCVPCAILAIRYANLPMVQHSRAWAALAATAYMAGILAIAWSLRSDMCMPCLTPILRVLLALLGLYPLVYLTDAGDARDVSFAALDTVVVLTFCWGLRARLTQAPVKPFPSGEPLR